MSDIVWSETKRHDIALSNKAKQIAQERSVLWKSPNKVSMTHSVLETDTNRHGQRYWRWVTHRAFGFFRSSKGTAIPFDCNRTKKTWSNNRPLSAFQAIGDPRLAKDESSEKYAAAVSQVFGIQKLSDLYPMVDYYGIDKFRGITPSILKMFRAGSPEEFTSQVFGKSRLTADLMQASLDQPDPYFVALAREYRGLVDDSVLLDIIKNNSFDEETISLIKNVQPSPSPSYIRNVLLLINEESVKSLSAETVNAQTFLDYENISRRMAQLKRRGWYHHHALSKDMTVRTVKQLSNHV